MPTISDLLSVGRLSLSAQQMALHVTGNNIANVNTNGYKRTQAVLAEGEAGEVRVNLRKDLSPAPMDPPSSNSPAVGCTSTYRTPSRHPVFTA